MYQLANLILDGIDSNFIGIFLYGSQNYGLDTEKSDRDAIIVIKEGKNASREVSYKNGVVKIYTLKYFLFRLQKGDMECYEILYTPHRFISEKYEVVFDKFVTSFTKEINLDRIKHALALKLSEHLSNVGWLPFGYSGDKYHIKRAYWCYRVFDQLTRVIQGEQLQSTFVYNASNREKMLKIKSIPNYLSLKELDKDLRKMQELLRNLPKYSIETTETEAVCLSWLYDGINSIQQEER